MSKCDFLQRLVSDHKVQHRATPINLYILPLCLIFVQVTRKEWEDDCNYYITKEWEDDCNYYITKECEDDCNYYITKEWEDDCNFYITKEWEDDCNYYITTIHKLI